MKAKKVESYNLELTSKELVLMQQAVSHLATTSEAEYVQHVGRQSLVKSSDKKYFKTVIAYHKSRYKESQALIVKLYDIAPR